MKVIVRCANNRITKADMEREIERLFQENKDLRVYVGHLHDELSLTQQQSEARRQKLVEKDALITELNDQIEAGNQELDNMHFDLCDKVNDQEKMSDEIADLRGELCVAKRKIDELKSRIAEICAQRDNYEASYKQVCEWWGNEQTKARKEAERAEEYRIALMESNCRVDECEKRMDWLSKEVLEWKAAAEGYKNQYEELKAQKEADDKKSEEICTACNERYEDVLAERNHLRSEVVRLTTERNTAVSENTELIFAINELQDKWEAEHNLRTEAEKAYDKVASEAYDMHQQITNLTIDNTRLENKVEELEAEVDACHHNIDGYIEGNRRMRSEYEKKMEAEQDQTKYWRKKYDEVSQKMEGYKTQLIVANQENLARAKAMEQLREEHDELEENFDELERVHKLWGEEIDRLRKVVTELQTNRFTTDEFIGMLMKNFVPSADKLDF